MVEARARKRRESAPLPGVVPIANGKQAPEGILRAIREIQENAEGVWHVWEGLANIFTDTLRVTFIFRQKSE